MNKFTTLIAGAAVALALISPATAAAYIKFDGVDGSVKSAEWRGGALYLTAETEEQAALLLPAVQAAREAAKRSKPQARKVAEFELSNGGKTWTLYDAVLRPTSDPKQVEVSYRCMDWADSRTGKSGSDCPGAARAGYGKDGAKGGNVEYEWKVEEGES